MSPNRFEGRCQCGACVPVGAGIIRRLRGAWVTVCADCAGLWHDIGDMRINLAQVVSVYRDYGMTAPQTYPTYRVGVSVTDGGYAGLTREEAEEVARKVGVRVEE